MVVLTEELELESGIVTLKKPLRQNKMATIRILKEIEDITKKGLSDEEVLEKQNEMMERLIRMYIVDDEDLGKWTVQDELTFIEWLHRVFGGVKKKLVDG